MNLKLIFFLALWKRPEITEICFQGLSRLRNDGRFEISVFAVISEPEMIPLCEKYGVEYCTHENRPLAKKMNFGISKLKDKEFDYMIGLGSDDILKDGFLDLYPFDKPVMALKDFVMLNTETGDCRRLSHRDAGYGLGRAISREVLQKMDWSLYNDRLNNGLDNNSEIKLAMNGFKTYRYANDEPMAIDLKSDENIWPFNHMMGNEYPFEKALSGLSEDEINSIRCLSLQKV